MSPEIMSEDNIEETPTDINEALESVEAKPSKGIGRWSPIEISEWRDKLRNAFVGMQADEAFKKKLSVQVPKSEPAILSGQFETDAEKAIKKDVIELEAEESTHAHLGGKSEPIVVANQGTEKPADQLKSAA